MERQGKDEVKAKAPTSGRISDDSGGGAYSSGALPFSALGVGASLVIYTHRDLPAILPRTFTPLIDFDSFYLHILWLGDILTRTPRL